MVLSYGVRPGRRSALHLDLPPGQPDQRRPARQTSSYATAPELAAFDRSRDRLPVGGPRMDIVIRATAAFFFVFS